MIINKRQGYQPMQRERKPLYPFINGMRSNENEGIGANRAENTWFKDGKLEKSYGAEVFKTIASIANIVFLAEFQKPDGAYQIIVCYKIGLVYKFRAIEEDGTLTVPAVEVVTAGAGTVTATNNSPNIVGASTAFETFFTIGQSFRTNPGDGRIYRVIKITDDTHITIDRPYEGTTIEDTGYDKMVNPGGVTDPDFQSDEFSFETVVGSGFLSNNASSNYLYQWTGTAIAPVLNATPYIRGLARDGKRLAIITPDGAEFSQDTPTTVFRGGTGVRVSGKYNTSIKSPRAIKSAGMGVIIIGETGTEAHKVITNAASDDVSADTKIDNYNDREHGVVLQKQVTMGKEFIWRVTPEGIMKTNPFNGQTVNVTDVGKIGRYWETWDISNSSIAYDENNEQVVCVVKEGGQNDTVVMIDASRDDMPISIKPSQYYNILATVNNQLYGGGSREGTIDKLFYGTTTITSDDIAFRYISEWMPLTNEMYWKLFKNLHISASLHPDSSMVVRIYFDGSTEASFEQTFTTVDTIGESGLTDFAYGMYIFGGSVEGFETANSDQIGESIKTKKFSTMCIEVYEKSSHKFKLHDIIVEYKTKNNFYHGLARKNVLFS